MAALEEERAVWSTAYIDSLPDTAFLYIEPGGTKDAEHKTVPRGLRHFPYKDANNNVDLPHLQNALSRIPQSDLPEKVKSAAAAKGRQLLAGANESKSMPREGLVRAVFPAELELRAASEGMPTLVGHFAVFDQWTEINSAFEGNFLERIAPSAFDKTFQERAPKVLFNHGADQQIGDKVLGVPSVLESDSTGARYEVPLLDTTYNRDLVPGLQAGAYGASFRFKVMREDVVKDAKRTTENPKGLPERTITEAQVLEFGPVTFPAYAGATAGIRSLTDRFQQIRVDAEDMATLACMIEAGAEYISDQDEPDDRKNIPVMEGVLSTLADLVAVEAAETEPPEPEDEEASAPTAPDGETREAVIVETSVHLDGREVAKLATQRAAPPHPELRAGAPSDKPNEKTEDNMSIEEMLERVDAIARELEQLTTENRGQLLSPEDEERYKSLRAEREDLVKRIDADREREEYLRSIKDDGRRIETVSDQFPKKRVQRDTAPDNVFALDEYHSRANSQEQLHRLYQEGAKRAIDGLEFADASVDEARAKANAERVVGRDGSSEVAQYILRHASPSYRSAFRKTLQGVPLTYDEQRTLGIATQGGQMPVPIQIDPTVTLVSNGYINPLREIARNVTMTGYEWRGVSTTGITAHYGAEGATAGDDSPTLLQPTIDAERAWTFVPYSFEVGQDWNGLEEELGVAIADAKDLLEATMFLTGAGHASSQPKGVLRSASTVIGTALNTNAGTVFTIQNVYELETALPPRFRPSATWVFNKAVAQRIRQFDTAGGAGLWSGYQPAPLQAPMPDRLLGYPVRELTTMSTAVPSGSGATWALFGDFSKFIIADRIGMSVSAIPQIFAGNTAGGIGYPTGQQGLYAFWRNSSDVMSSNAFRGGTQS